MTYDTSVSAETDAQAQLRVLGSLARQWKERRDQQGYKPGTPKHAKAQIEFFVGAYAALQIATDIRINEGVFILLAVGRDSYALWGKENINA